MAPIPSRIIALALSLGITGPPTLVTRAADAPGVNWPSFHGPSGCGVAEGFPTPTSWNVTDGTNIKWKTPIPGLAHSSPVIWQDRVFVTTAVSDGNEQKLKVGLYGDIDPVIENAPFAWKVLCVDKNSGNVLWEKTAHRGVPKIKRHPKSTHANSTPATDGKRVVAFFGAEGLYCYDMEGNPLWSKDLGLLDSGYYRAPDAQWGFASSPVIEGDKVYVQCDVQKDSFVAAFDAADGRELWRTPRQDVPTWGTPTLYHGTGGTQVIANGYKNIGGYDASTGKQIWTLRGGGDIPVPTPIVAHDLIFITNGHGGAMPVYAIRPSAAGDITPAKGESSNPSIAWSNKRGGNYMQTPVVYGDYLYCCLDNGALTCFEATTGKQIYRQRLGEGTSGFTASGVAADGKLYFISEEGEVHVIRAGPDFAEIAANPLGEICMASPAISGGVLFFRTQSHLIAIGEKALKR